MKAIYRRKNEFELTVPKWQEYNPIGAHILIKTQQAEGTN